MDRVGGESKICDVDSIPEASDGNGNLALTDDPRFSDAILKPLRTLLRTASRGKMRERIQHTFNTRALPSQQTLFVPFTPIPYTSISHSRVGLNRSPIKCVAPNPSFCPAHFRWPRLPTLVNLRFDKVPKNIDWADDEDDTGDGRGGKGPGGRGGSGSGGHNNDEDPDEYEQPLKDRMVSWISRHPIKSKMATTILVGFLGDFVAQRLEISRSSDPSKQMIWKRAIAAGAFGIFAGPLLHGWFAFLSRLGAGLGKRGIVLKVLLDQAIFAWIFNGGYLMGTKWVLEGKFSTAVRAVKTSLPKIMMMNWRIWPAMQFINFFFIPTGLQVLWANAFGFIWVIVLSSMSHAAKKPKLKPQPA